MSFMMLFCPNATAYHAWFLLDAFFCDNLAGRAVHIGAEFLSTVQGDMTIAEYYRRLKALADALDEHITDKTLTLQLIRGLSPQFGVMASLLPMQLPFPTFVQAKLQADAGGDQSGRSRLDSGGHHSHRHQRCRLVQLQHLWRPLAHANWRHHPTAA